MRTRSTILNGYVPGQMMLTTATQQVLLNNRSPAPSNWPTLQLYQPGGVFTMSQVGNANVSNAYVVYYTGDVSATVSNYRPTHTCCDDFTGASMVRNIAVDGEGMRDIETWLAKKDGGDVLPARSLRQGAARCAADAAAGRDHRLRSRRQHRGTERHAQAAPAGAARWGAPGWKDAAIETAKPAVGRLAQAW